MEAMYACISHTGEGKLAPFPSYGITIWSVINHLLRDGGNQQACEDQGVYEAFRLTSHNEKVTSFPFLPAYRITVCHQPVMGR